VSVDDGNHRVTPAVEQVGGCAVTQVAGVLHIKWDRICTPQLVTDVFGDEACRQPERCQSVANPDLDDVPEIYFAQPQMLVFVAFERTKPCEILGRQSFDQTFGQDGRAICVSVARALDNGPDEDVGDVIEADWPGGELFRNHRERGTRCLADAQRQMSGLAAHADQQVPAPDSAGIDHQVLHNFDAHVSRGLKPEGRDAVRQVQIVINGLRHVHDAKPSGRVRCQPHCREGGVVTADGHQSVDT
jgi:hypothetical protein